MSRYVYITRFILHLTYFPIQPLLPAPCPYTAAFYLQIYISFFGVWDFGRKQEIRETNTFSHFHSHSFSLGDYLTIRFILSQSARPKKREKQCSRVKVKKLESVAVASGLQSDDVYGHTYRQIYLCSKQSVQFIRRQQRFYFHLVLFSCCYFVSQRKLNSLKENALRNTTRMRREKRKNIRLSDRIHNILSTVSTDFSKMWWFGFTWLGIQEEMSIQLISLFSRGFPLIQVEFLQTGQDRQHGRIFFQCLGFLQIYTFCLAH